MSTLVQMLAAGVKGAENGTATFLLRGTASSAASDLYNDFEKTSQPGTNIISLDSNGAAEVYTNVYVDVVIKNSAGTTLRTVTIGNGAKQVEVISDSFTGTAYSGSPTATSQPITLAAVLDKWDNSAGADDWQILVNGVATNISTAFAGIAGLFFNVKDPAYGAVGDGVTDDTTAIGLAIAAADSAGGGIVYFPSSATSYVFTTLTISSDSITLMGAGPQSSVLTSASTSGDLISFTDNTVNRWKRLIGLGITSTGASANNIIQFEEAQNVVVDNCEFICSGANTGRMITRSSGNAFSHINFRDCSFRPSSTNDSIIGNEAADNACFYKLVNCKFILPASFVGEAVRGPNFSVTDCVFDGSAVTSGTCTFVNSTSNSQAGRYIGRFVGNTFIDGGSTSICFGLTSLASSANFHEDCNSFIGFTAPSAVTSADKIYNISHNSQDAYKVCLGSRRGRTLEITHNSTGSTTINAGCSYEVLFINYTAAGNVTIVAPISNMTNGSRLMVTLLNNSGSQRDVVLDYGESVQTYGSATDVTLQPNDGERCVFIMEFMHFSAGAPLCFITGAVED